MVGRFTLQICSIKGTFFLELSQLLKCNIEIKDDAVKNFNSVIFNEIFLNLCHNGKDNMYV